MNLAAIEDGKKLRGRATAPAIDRRTTLQKSVQRYALLATRLIAGLVFWQHGLEKLFGFAGARPEPTLWGIRGVAAILETLGGPLLALGVAVRPVAFILSGEMAVAYFRAWAPRGFFPIANGGEEATLNTFLFLWLAAAGAGALSVDGWLEKKYRWSPWQQLARWEPYVRVVLQCIVGFLLVLHGVRTLFGVLPSVAGRRNAVTLALDALPHVAGYLEVVGGVLLGLGVLVRPASAILCVEALIAYLFIAMPRGRWPTRNGGNEALLYVAVLLSLAVAKPVRGLLAAATRLRRQ